MPKINWNEILESNILILKENEPIRVRFLDNGNKESYEIIDKKTEKPKSINKYVFNVIDLTDNIKKEFSTLASTLMTKLKEFIPLKDKSLTINKFKTGFTDFDVDFKISLIE